MLGLTDFCETNSAFTFVNETKEDYKIKIMKKFILSVLITIVSVLNSSAQTVDHYNSSGKLMAVILCVAVILIGIGLFLFSMERRISSMEQSLEDEASTH